MKIIWNHKLLNLVLAQTCFAQSRQLPCTTNVGPVFALPEPYTLFPWKIITAHPAQYIPGVLIVVLLAAFFIGSNLAPLRLFFPFLMSTGPCRGCYWKGQTIPSHESNVFCFLFISFLVDHQLTLSLTLWLCPWDVSAVPAYDGTERNSVLFLSNMNNGGMKKQPAVFIQ